MFDFLVMGSEGNNYIRLPHKPIENETLHLDSEFYNIDEVVYQANDSCTVLMVTCQSKD